MKQAGAILAILTPIVAGLIWIGSGVWRIARWTERQDLKMATIESWKDATTMRLGAIEADVTELKVNVARMTAGKGK